MAMPFVETNLVALTDGQNNQVVLSKKLETTGTVHHQPERNAHTI